MDFFFFFLLTNSDPIINVSRSQNSFPGLSCTCRSNLHSLNNNDNNSGDDNKNESVPALVA